MIPPEAKSKRTKENKSKSHLKRKPVPSIPSKFSAPSTYQPITEPVTPEPASKVCKVISPVLPPPTSITTAVPASHHRASVPARALSSSSSSLSSSSSVASSLSPAMSVHPEPAELFQFQEIDSEEEYAVKELDAPVYHPTSKEHIRLEGMALAQKQRIYLNVGGTKFETSVPTLQSDPRSLLARMVLPISPLKPYSVDNVYVYFLDRDPKLFSFILNYLRHGTDLPLSCLPSDVHLLSLLQQEAQFFCLSGYYQLLEKNIVRLSREQ
ncbi:uncharacterized protein LOC111115722 [Crassostrea virginica]